MPLARAPLLGHQVDEVLVVKLERLARPRPVESRSHLVAAPQRVCAGQRDDLLVSEPHALAEQGPQVVGTLGSVGQATVGNSSAFVRVVRAAKVERDRRAAQELDGSAAGHREQVSMRDLWVGHLDIMQQVADCEIAQAR